MADGCFIGIDQGSSATKAVVLSATGQLLYQARKDLAPPFREGNRVEQDPREILKSVQDVLDESVLALQGTGIPVIGAGLSCQRSSCLAWDEATGDPLSSVISWRDTRGSDLAGSLRERAPFIFQRSGLPLTPYYAASKFRWLKDNLPSAGQPGALFGTLSSFLAQMLTREKKAVIDHTNAARTQLMNVHALSWDDELLQAFGLAGIALPGIVPTAHPYGQVRTAAGDVPLLSCIGDQQAAMIGLGVIEPGDGGINYGTGGFLIVNTGGALTHAEGMMASVHYSVGGANHYLIEGSVNAVGEALEWARARLGLFKEYPDVDDLCWKAATDVVAFVGINGTGAPHWETDITSSFHGLTPESTSADMVRAVVEGIAFFLREIAERIASAGVDPVSFALSGGLASISYLVQLQADMLGKDIRVSATRETSALGAAFLAGMQHGTWKAADIKAMTAAGETVSGEKNPGADRRYRRWKELHRMTGELDKM